MAAVATQSGCSSGFGACERPWKLLLASANTHEEGERAQGLAECAQENELGFGVSFLDRATRAPVTLDTDTDFTKPITVEIEVTRFWNQRTLREWNPISTENALRVLIE